MRSAPPKCVSSDIIAKEMAVKAMSTRAGAPRAAARPCARGIVAPQQRPVLVRGGPVCAVKEAETESRAKAAKDEDIFDDGPEVAPSTHEVQQLLNTLVSDTEIAEMELRLGGFKLRVRRAVDGATGAAPAAPIAVAAPAAAAAAVAAVPAYQSVDDAVAPEDTIDEGLVYVTAIKVGVFRRGKYVGGKKVGKGNVANVGDQVKKGQTLGYIEQLGTFVEVKAPQAGEVASYKVEDGDAVEYMQQLVELAPFFAGHIIGESKYA